MKIFKKTTPFFISIFLFAVLMLSGPFNQSHAALIAYYDFEGNANDASGNGYDGTVAGATLTGGGYNDTGAYAFDGNDHISIDLNINPAAIPHLTMGAWVKANSANPIRQVISHDNGGYDRSLGIDYRGGTSGWSAFSGTGAVLGAYPVMPDEWIFIAAVYDQSNSQVMLYVNGAVISETGTMGTGNIFTHIGNNPLGGGVEHFSGLIDEVFFFDKALSKAQLDGIMANGVMPVPVPASLLLLCTGLIGFAGTRRRQ